jgi:uncharacterized membrane protein
MGILADLREFVRVSDNKTFFMAILMIISFILIFTATLFTRDDATLKTVSAIWGTWVGAVIGYFFGSRQVDELIEH